VSDSKTIVDAMRELVEALDAVESGMSIESNEHPAAWFTRAELRVKKARAHCAAILSARKAQL
jgi:hypothetical protein